MEINSSFPRLDRHKDTHAEAERAKALHGRPQDASKPDVGTLREGEKVLYPTHSGLAVAEVDKDMGTASAVLGTNLHTREGRDEHSSEHLYRVIDERSGEESVLRKSDLVSQADSDASAFGAFTDKVQPSGALDANSTDRKGPRRK